MGDWVFLLSYGKLLCLNAADGKEAGSRDLDAQFHASPVVAGGKLYLARREGKVMIIKANPACGVVGSATLGEPVGATPAVAGGCLFVRTAKALYCISRGGMTGLDGLGNPSYVSDDHLCHIEGREDESHPDDPDDRLSMPGAARAGAIP